MTKLYFPGWIFPGTAETIVYGQTESIFSHAGQTTKKRDIPIVWSDLSCGERNIMNVKFSSYYNHTEVHSWSGQSSF